MPDAVVTTIGGGGGAFDGVVPDDLTFTNIAPVFILTVSVDESDLAILSVQGGGNTNDLEVGFKVTSHSMGWGSGETTIIAIDGNGTDFTTAHDASSTHSNQLVCLWDGALEAGPAVPAAEKGILYIRDKPMYPDGNALAEGFQPRVLQYKNDEGDIISMSPGVSRVYRDEDDEVGIQFTNSTDASATNSLYGGGIRIWKQDTNDGAKGIIGNMLAAPLMIGCDPMQWFISPPGGGFIECGLGGKISMGKPSFIGGPAPTERLDIQDGALAMVRYGTQTGGSTDPSDPSDTTNCHLYSKLDGGKTKLFFKRYNGVSWDEEEIAFV